MTETFFTVDLELLEQADPSTLHIKRVIARLWKTVEKCRDEGRKDKAERAEALAMKLRAYHRSQREANK
jgi:hypothetical protein